MQALRSTFVRPVASVLMSLFLLAAVSVAATTQPLAEPFGLTLDSAGNLYVANFQVGQVLVYNPSYQQIPSKTITTTLRAPTGLAFDINGNLYVADESYNAINEYSPAHKLLQQITNYGIAGPVGLAIDGIGNLFVNNSFQNISVLCPELNYEVMQSVNASSMGVNTVNGIATRGAVWALGTDQGFEPNVLDLFLAEGSVDGDLIAGTTGSAVAFDKSGNIYSANLDGTVDYYNFATQTSTLFKNVGYISRGMVVDNARGRVYIANFQGNEVQVYSTKGVLLSTIH